MKLQNFGNAIQIDYPVGEYIKFNLKCIKQMVSTIIDFNIPKSNRIVLCGRGSSGDIISGIIASMLEDLYNVENMTIYHIKKPNEDSHSSNMFSFHDSDKIIIIDDFIASGYTLQQIYGAILNNYRHPDIYAIIMGGGLGSAINLMNDINPEHLVVFSCKNYEIVNNKLTENKYFIN